MTAVYLRGLVDKIFAILPLYEEYGSQSAEYAKYIDSLWIEMSGACTTFPELWDESCYISALNVMAFLNTNPVTHAQCKRETFKAIDLVKKAYGKIGGGSNE